jgi:hypothetical protein
MWRAGREPVDDMYWCEAEYDGTWTNVIILDKVRTRREILDRLLELETAVVGFDFPFSFPKPFIDFLASEGISGGWRQLANSVRDDLKKNTDDGIRLWIERIGRYRESKLEPMDEALRRLPPPRGRERRPKTLAAHDLRSFAERFRRIETIVRHKNERAQWSALAIKHNKLTGRYEFPESEARGRKALVGISMLAQASEAKESLAVWPFSRPAALTLVEIVHEVFPKAPANDDLQAYFEKEEDRALHIERDVIETVIANDAAKQTLFSLIGMMKAERREEKAIRPLRDFRDQFYANQLISVEGWAYGIGFRDTSAPEPQSSQQPIEQGSQEPGALTEIVEEAN